MKGVRIILCLMVFVSIYMLSCALKDPYSSQNGKLIITLQFPEESGHDLKKETSLTFDKVDIKITNSSKKVVIDQTLTQSDSVFKGDFKVTAGKGYTIEIFCYQSSIIIFQGIRSGVSVEGKKTTHVQIELTSASVGIEISPASLELEAGNTQQFIAYGVYPDDKKLDVTSSTEWSTDPNTAGTISGDGLFTADSTLTGTETVTATYEGETATATVMVNRRLTSLEVIPSSVDLISDETQQFTCIAYYSDGNNDDVTSAVIWSTDPDSAGSITPDGLFKADSTITGIEIVSATFGGQQAIAQVTVNRRLMFIEVNPSSIDIPNGDIHSFFCTAYYSDRSSEDVTSFAVWSISPGDAGSIDTSGVFPADSTITGNEIISAVFQGKLATAAVTVHKRLKSIDVIPANTILINSENQQFTCSALYSDGDDEDVTSSVAWSNTPGTAGRIDTDGLFTASDSTIGTEWVIADFGGHQDSATVEVIRVLEYIEVTPSFVELSNSETQQFMCNAYYSDGYIEDVTTDVLCNISPETAGGINDTGLFTASGSVMGTETVTASYLGMQSSATVIVVMIYISAGQFTMGSNDGEADEQPVHTVYLDAYYIDKYEVTNQHYADYLNEALIIGEVQASPTSVTKDGIELLNLDSDDCRIQFVNGEFVVELGKANHPVIEVTWFGANAYAEHHGKRLPTEAEWEKAARGTADERTYPWGDRAPTSSHCNFYNHVGLTTPVGQYSPTGNSPYGCCDMAGNVWEWCADWYRSNFYTYPQAGNNPTGPSSGTSRVLRGGSWKLKDVDNIRCANRYAHEEGLEYTGNDIGFRCVRDANTAGYH